MSPSFRVQRSGKPHAHLLRPLSMDLEGVPAAGLRETGEKGNARRGRRDRKARRDPSPGTTRASGRADALLREENEADGDGATRRPRVRGREPPFPDQRPAGAGQRAMPRSTRRDFLPFGSRNGRLAEALRETKIALGSTGWSLRWHRQLECGDGDRDTFPE